MYIHWQRRKRLGHKCWDRQHSCWRRTSSAPTLIATLVTSKRIDGKPRQTRICYLGSIREDRLGNTDEDRWRNAYYLRTFYEHAEAKMRAANVAPEDRLAIHKMLALRVPPPNDFT